MKKTVVNGTAYRSFAAACAAHGVNVSTAKARIESGWTVEDAISEPAGRPGRRCAVTVGNVTYPTIKSACDELGVSYATYRRRMSRGATIEQAFGVEPMAEPITCPRCDGTGITYATRVVISVAPGEGIATILTSGRYESYPIVTAVLDAVRAALS